MISELPPVLEVDPGDMVVFRTLDADWGLEPNRAGAYRPRRELERARRTATHSGSLFDDLGTSAALLVSMRTSSDVFPATVVALLLPPVRSGGAAGESEASAASRGWLLRERDCALTRWCRARRCSLLRRWRHRAPATDVDERHRGVD